MIDTESMKLFNMYLILLWLFAYAWAQGDANQGDFTINYSLPAHLRPVHYDVTVGPVSFLNDAFSGNVRIEFQVLEASDNITLHTRGLNIRQEAIQVILEDGAFIEVLSTAYDGSREFYIIQLNESFPTGIVLYLDIAYEGSLNDENVGLYRGSYTFRNGTERWFIASHLQPINARQVFPCFDEPALKATFSISVIYESASYNCVSNTKLLGVQSWGADFFRADFEKSELMPTNMVALVISDFHNISRDSQSVFAKYETIQDDRVSYALDIGVNALTAIGRLINIAYTLDTIDQFAIPDGYLNADAVANWGLITYKERNFLYSSDISTTSEKQNIASTICAKLAQQWFGNLVTPTEWRHVWLSLGFATYYRYYATDIVEPGMRMTEQFVTLNNHHALEIDSFENTRALSTDPATIFAVASLFDAISSEKAAALIRMTENFMTTQVFQRGVYYYVNDTKFSSADPGDLWNSLQNSNTASGNVLQDLVVEEVMDSWIAQAGYPVLFVERNSDGNVTFSQERFHLKGEAYHSSEIWHIPISYTTSDNINFHSTRPSYWLRSQSELSNIILSNGEWILVNLQETGYFRVNYDEDNWNMLISYLNSDYFGIIHLLNRAQLIDDAFNLARAGHLRYNKVFELIKYVSRETDYIPIYSFMKGIDHLNIMISASEQYSTFKEFIRDLLQTAYDGLGTELRENDSHTNILSRLDVLNLLCKMEHDDCLQKMSEQLSTWTVTSPDLQAAVYCGGMRETSLALQKFIFLITQYNQPNIEDLQKERLLAGLGCATTLEELTRLLNMCIDEEPYLTLRHLDKGKAFTAIYSSSKYGLDVAFDFLLSNFDKIRNSMEPDQVESILIGISSRLTTEEQMQAFVDFVNDQSSEMQEIFHYVFDEALNAIEENINWGRTYLPVIEDWLESTTEPSGNTTEPPGNTTEPADTGNSNRIHSSIVFVLGWLLIVAVC